MLDSMVVRVGSVFLIGLGSGLLTMQLREALSPKKPIGAIAEVEETSSGLNLTARVDTGAGLSSVHCSSDDIKIEEPSPDPAENVGKPVRIRLENHEGQQAWIDSVINGFITIRNAEHCENRYCVSLKVRYEGQEREVQATLNDRSKMKHRMLLGREFLEGAYVVDVEQDSASPGDTGSGSREML